MESFPIQSLSDLTLYLQNKEQFLLVQEKRRWAIEQKAKEEELAFQRKQEEERRQKEEKEKSKQLFIEKRLSQVLEEDTTYKEYNKRNTIYTYLFIANFFIIIVLVCLSTKTDNFIWILPIILTGISLCVLIFISTSSQEKNYEYLQSLREKLEEEYNQTHP